MIILIAGDLIIRPCMHKGCTPNSRTDLSLPRSARMEASVVTKICPHGGHSLQIDRVIGNLENSSRRNVEGV